MSELFFIPRSCTESVPDNQGERKASETPAVFNLDGLLAETKDAPVYVLLGEPGMGKTSAFKHLSEHDTGSIYLTVHEFLKGREDANWRNQTVYIDGLDEYRSGQSATALNQVLQRLSNNHVTRYRLSCRSADWHSKNDTNDAALPAGRAAARLFYLNPLNEAQMRQYLESKQHPDPQNFIAQANSLGFAEMLGNPQSLQILFEASLNNQETGQLPSTRRGAYALACKGLLKELNERHDGSRQNLSDDELLFAAGWVCAVLLLSNRDSILLQDSAAENPNSIRINDLNLKLATSARSNDERLASPSRDAVEVAIKKTRLFKKDPATSAYMPIHRTIAEYLAAGYLNTRFTNGLPAKRLESWLILKSAQTHHIPSSLRGLAGWLGALCAEVRFSLIQADPVGMLEYSDLSLLSRSDKEFLIQQLSINPVFHYNWGYSNLAPNWKPLVDSGMQDFVQEWLNQFISSGAYKASGENGSQSTLAYVLFDALYETASQASWCSVLELFVRQTDLPMNLRRRALDGMIHHAGENKANLLVMLNDCNSGVVHDPERSLMGGLLYALYLKVVTVDKIFDYLYQPPNKYSAYLYGNFWSHSLLSKGVKFEDLLCALEHFAAQRFAAQTTLDASETADDPDEVNQYLGNYFLKAIIELGTTEPIKRVANWIAYSTTTFPKPLFPIVGEEMLKSYLNWVRQNPERVKQLIAYRLNVLEQPWFSENFLDSSCWPSDMGIFYLTLAQQYLSQASETNYEQASHCLFSAYRLVENGHATSGINLNDIEQFVSQNSQIESYYQTLIVCDLEKFKWQSKSWKMRQLNAKKQLENNQVEHTMLSHYLNHLNEVSLGKHINLLVHFAAFNKQRLQDEYYPQNKNNREPNLWHTAYESNPSLVAAIEQGCNSLLLGLKEETGREALTLYLEQKPRILEAPVLLAAKRMFESTSDAFFALGEERLKALIKIQLCSYTELPEWLLALSSTQLVWIKECFAQSIKTELKRDDANHHISWLRNFTHRKEYQTLARHILPMTLVAFPIKVSEKWMHEFVKVLLACVDVCPADQVRDLINSRLQKKSISTLQTGYLLMAGLFVDSPCFEPQLAVLLSTKKISYEQLVSFVGYFEGGHGHPYEFHQLSNTSVTQLIAKLAPHITSELPKGTHYVTNAHKSRDFIFALINKLKRDPSADAAQCLAQLLSQPEALHDWLAPIREAAALQAATKLESEMSVPLPTELAQAFANQTPLNHLDLQAMAIDYLDALQADVRHIEIDLINSFWNVDSSGKKAIKPHLAEPQCRNVILGWLKPRVSKNNVAAFPEMQHSRLNQSDIELLVQASERNVFRLPIELKGDWHDELWTAASQQLLKKYALNPRCGGYGIYLVLWTGGGARANPSNLEKPTTAAALQCQMTQFVLAQPGCENIKVFVLDISI